MMPFLTPDDLAPYADIPAPKAAAMIADAEAMARLIAPCIDDEDFPHGDVLKAILRGAILRWHDAGSGALTQHSQTAGPFTNSESYDTRMTRRGMFWPTEIAQLRELCSGGLEGRAFEIDTTPADAPGVLGVDYWWTTPTHKDYLP